jgi:hypothetical protein
VIVRLMAGLAGVTVRAGRRVVVAAVVLVGVVA